jgi:hypothetical protein
MSLLGRAFPPYPRPSCQGPSLSRLDTTDLPTLTTVTAEVSPLRVRQLEGHGPPARSVLRTFYDLYPTHESLERTDPVPAMLFRPASHADSRQDPTG